MYCPNCKATIIEGAAFCDQCGAPLQNYAQPQQSAAYETEETMRQENNFSSQTQSAESYGAPYSQNTAWQTPNPYAQPQPQPAPYNAGNQTFQNNCNVPIKNYDPSKDYTPISMWGYFGYQLLFAIPIIGFILILIFSFGGTKNINLRNYARSTFCLLIVLLGAVLLVALFGLIGTAIAMN